MSALADTLPSVASRAARQWRGLSRELLIVVIGIAVYFGVRGVTASDAETALQNAGDLIRWEKAAGIYVEPTLQGLVDNSDALLTVLNWIYIWGHWPVIVAVLLWLFRHHAAGYREVRDTMLLSGGIGLLVFITYPVAPPRLAGLGLVDSVTELSTAYRVLQPPAFVNQYAAMPSLHVGWDLVMGIALVSFSGSLAVRVMGRILPVLMVAAVVLTANHYIVDAVAGALLVLACRWILRRRGARTGQDPFVPQPRGAETVETCSQSPIAAETPSTDYAKPSKPA